MGTEKTVFASNNFLDLIGQRKERNSRCCSEDTVRRAGPRSKTSPGPSAEAYYLHTVCVVQEWRLLHSEVMGDQGVEAIREIQDLGVTAALGHCLEGKETEGHRTDDTAAVCTSREMVIRAPSHQHGATERGRTGVL